MTREIRTRFAVVGSGAGGSVVAYHLARAGERVVVIERGRRVPTESMNADEVAMVSALYKDGGSQMNTGLDMFVLQGSCVGGTTVLTNGVCFRLPDRVRRTWARDGFELDPAQLEESYARVESVLNVQPLPERLQNSAAPRLRDGFRALGLEPRGFHKNFLHCLGCGSCNIGCRFGRKLDAAQTWIPMAESHGCEVLPDLEAVRIEHHRGHATAILCRRMSNGEPIAVRAERFVVSGGAINTPELLLRSKIAPSLAGIGTSFNAGAIAFAEYPEPLDAFEGDQMGVWYAGDGYVIEQIHNPPLSFALTLPGGMDTHRARMERYRYLTSAGVLVPTRPVGRVFLGLGHRLLPRLFNHAEIEFELPESDLASLREGFRTLARAYLASGATQVFIPFHEPAVVRSESELEDLDRRLRSQKDIANFGSSHPQGGACAGSDPKRHVCSPDLRVRGFDNLYVCDASVFPSSAEVNPQLPIMAIADYAVRSIGGFVPPLRIEEGPAHRARTQFAASAEAF